MAKKEGTKYLNMPIDETLHHKLKVESALTGKTMTEIVGSLLEEHYEEQKSMEETEEIKKEIINEK